MAKSSFDQTHGTRANNSNTENCVVVFRRPSDRASAAAHQVNDQDYQGNDQQQVNQPARHVEAETHKPQN
jgi:hypothetical protein